MKTNFERALAVTLRYEGGWSNHPKDPGGATMKGVTQAVYDRWRSKRGEPTRSVRNITTDELREIYRLQYWRLVSGDELPAGVDLAVFDFAVNSGATRAIQMLQKCLDIRVDGNPGACTIEAAMRADAATLISALCERRLAFMRKLSTWSTFGKGWSRRVHEVEAAARAMVPGEVFASADPVGDVTLAGNGGDDDLMSDAGAPADPEAVGVLATRQGQGVAVTSLGAAGTAISDVAQQIEPISYVSNTLRWVFVALLIAGALLTAYGVLKAIREGRLG